MRIKIKIKNEKFFLSLDAFRTDSRKLSMRTEKLMTKNFLFVRFSREFSFLSLSLFLWEEKCGKCSKITCWHMAIVWRHQSMVYSRSIKVFLRQHNSDDAVKIFPPHSHVNNKKKSLSEMNDVVQPLTNSSYAVIPHMCGVLLIGTIHSSNTPSSLLFSILYGDWKIV